MTDWLAAAFWDWWLAHRLEVAGSVICLVLVFIGGLVWRAASLTLSAWRDLRKPLSPRERVRRTACEIVSGLRDGSIVPDPPLSRE